MRIKDKVLLILEENKGSCISGEALAKELDVSRAAIWKAVKSLQEQGHNITAGTNKGYCLGADSDILTEQGIKSYLATSVVETEFVPDVIVYDTIESTNRTARQMAFDGATHGTSVVANHQTQGRGRLGRSFYSPAQSGIYLSIVLKPNTNAAQATLLTTMAATAVSEAIDKVCDVETEIKWVNDIYLDGKKICGILTEAVTNFESGQIESVILGIGINCAPPSSGVPEELKDIMGFIPRNNNFSRNQLTAKVICRVLERFKTFETADFLEVYRKRSMLIGCEINVFKSGLTGEATPAMAVDIDSVAGLIVEYIDGTRETLTSGEVSVRKI